MPATGQASRPNSRQEQKQAANEALSSLAVIRRIYMQPGLDLLLCFLLSSFLSFDDVSETFSNLDASTQGLYFC